MTALTHPRPALRVVRGPGRSSPESETDNAVLERRVHDEDVAAFVAKVRPLIRRAEVMAYEIGPAAFQTVRGIATAVDQLERRWTDPTGRAA